MEDSEVIRPTIEVVRVPSIERASFRPLDGVQLRAQYSHVRIGTYCPEPISEPKQLVLACEKPPIEQQGRYKKNLGPVSRLLKRRHHAANRATKSCDNIYSVNKTNNYFEWKQSEKKHNEQGMRTQKSHSLDWRASRAIERNAKNLESRKGSRSAEQLSRNSVHTPTAKSKIVSILKRLSPRMTRPSSKGSFQSSPSICPWVQVDYTDDNNLLTSEFQEVDFPFQEELHFNEIKKMALKLSTTSPQKVIKECSNGLITEIKSPMHASAIQVLRIRDNSISLNSTVHEDQSSEERRRQSQLRQEVADLEDTIADGGCAGQAQYNNLSTYPKDGSNVSNGIIKRHTRPLSLAVQPLNYQRFDPELSVIATTTNINNTSSVALVNNNNNNNNNKKNNNNLSKSGVNFAAGTAAGDNVNFKNISNNSSAKNNKKIKNMTSQESIGSCSLDVEKSASDRSEPTLGSLSEKTLHSLNLSCNGEASTTTTTKASADDQVPSIVIVSNGHSDNLDDIEEADHLTNAKKPSYLGLACSISGYSGITRYDSKLREGFRSRDSSPGARLINSDSLNSTSIRSADQHHSHVPNDSQPKSHSISPLSSTSSAIMDQQRHNGFANGSISIKCKIDTYSEVTVNNFSQQQHQQHIIGVIKSPKQQNNSPLNSKLNQYTRSNKSYSPTLTASPRSTNVSLSTHNDSSILNGSADSDCYPLNVSSSSEKSFIQQRVERLYGPGALAQGFFRRSSGNKFDLSNCSSNKSSPNGKHNISQDFFNESTDEVDESVKNLPVLRHLRPEFRAQLPVVSPRRPTDGTEQVIKPLKRISLGPSKNDAKETKICQIVQEIDIVKDANMTSSITSLTDQQPAAPQVILPVVDTISNLAKQNVQSLSDVKEKDGHYFMGLLNKERERLFSLALSAETELEQNLVTLPEEAAGKLRSAAGKARLLATQKMQQFEGLCQKNITQKPGEEFPTTSEDLAGFWDMVMLQVVQVNDMFEQLDRSRKSQWKEIINEPKVTSATPSASALKRRPTPASKAKSSANAESARKAREAREETRRQLIEERRRAMRSNSNKSKNSVEIFVPET